MAEKMSTGLCNQLLDTASLKDVFANDSGPFLNIYDGTPPTTADAAATGTLLCTVSTNSSGSPLNWDAAGSTQGGVMPKASADTWSGTNLADGNASYYRYVGASDDGSASTTQPRIQGTIGVGGADMNLGTVALVNGATFTVAYASQAFIPS